MAITIVTVPLKERVDQFVSFIKERVDQFVSFIKERETLSNNVNKANIGSGTKQMIINK